MDGMSLSFVTINDVLPVCGLLLLFVCLFVCYIMYVCLFCFYYCCF